MQNIQHEEILNYVTVKESHDCFNGEVAIFENTDLETDVRFWVEQERKDVQTDYMTLEAAQHAFDEFMNDTMF